MINTNSIPRNEHPRPDFMRENWMCLNGEWDFSIGDDKFDRKIIVPFVCESKLSGVEDKRFHPIVWYRKTFFLPLSMQGKRIVLHFGAVDYYCWVWVNGRLAIEHEGGQSSFCCDVTEYLSANQRNTIVVRVKDEPQNLQQPRGKQFWEEEPRSIFYTRSTGIWQSVWLEAVGAEYLRNVRIEPDYDRKSVHFTYNLSSDNNSELEAEISFEGKAAGKIRTIASGKSGNFTIGLSESELDGWNFYEDFSWSPESPRLFDVTFRLYCNGRVEDEVHSYFGMRKISIENGTILLNNRPYFQKLVLDQGYWPESLMTAPTDSAFIKDIKLIKEMGFNGVRMHQKVEDPRFLYHADRMGLLVWGEIGSAYVYSAEYAMAMYKEWPACVERDCNHPCIIAWTPLNESWGVQELKANKMQQSHCLAMFHVTKSIDGTRLVVDNDGWEHTHGDMCTIHDYESNEKVFLSRYSSLEKILEFSPGGRALYASGFAHSNQPIIVSEFGGICFHADDALGWGYSTDTDTNEYVAHICALMGALLESPYVQGYCYTQLYDIETEQNGLLYYDRRPKVDPILIRQANRS